MADNVICTSYNYLSVISVMLVGAKYLRVGNCLFLCVQGWGREHEVKKILQIPGGYLAAEIDREGGGGGGGGGGKSAARPGSEFT